MNFEIIDYNIHKHKFLDEWIDESKNQNAKLINMYATFNEPFSKTYQYFLEHPYDMANIKSFIKLFAHDNVIYGVVVFHYFNEKDKFYMGINPIVINPQFLGRGIGTKILKRITNQANKITEGHVDIVKADTEETNIASIKMLEKVGFIKAAKNNNFVEYIYKIINEK